MESSFFIRAELHGKIRYWNCSVGLHSGIGKLMGFSSYKNKEEADKIVKKLQSVFDPQIKFSVLPDEELPFIKKQKRERLRHFKAAARLVVDAQRASSKMLQNHLKLRVDQGDILISRLMQYGIVGEPVDKTFTMAKDWQKEYSVLRMVKIKSQKELKEKLANIIKVFGDRL